MHPDIFTPGTYLIIAKCPNCGRKMTLVLYEKGLQYVKSVWPLNITAPILFCFSQYKKDEVKLHVSQEKLKRWGGL